MKALEFKGNGWEYFKIWIVNAVLIVLTLGLYYPWAKVRRNRYFYGNSVFEDRNFEYHALGKQIFFSYLIALVLFIAYVFLSNVVPIFGSIFFLGLLVAIPWVIVRSMMFNLKMTSFSNVRFSFEKDFTNAYLNFLLYPLGFYIFFFLLIMITAGLFAIHPVVGVIGLAGLVWFIVYTIAYFKKIHSEFYINNTSFGQGKFTSNLQIKELMKISLKTMGVGLLLTVAVFVILGTAVYTFIGLEPLQTALQNAQSDTQNSTFVLLLIGAVYVGMILVMIATMAYSFAVNRAYIYQNMSLNNEINFSSTLQALPFMWIVISNFFLILFTLGFGAPWAKVRVARVVLSNTHIDAPNGFDNYLSKEQAQTSAIGEQIGEAFDVDVGLGF